MQHLDLPGTGPTTAYSRLLRGRQHLESIKVDSCVELGWTGLENVRTLDLGYLESFPCTRREVLPAIYCLIAECYTVCPGIHGFRARSHVCGVLSMRPSFGTSTAQFQQHVSRHRSVETLLWTRTNFYLLTAEFEQRHDTLEELDLRCDHDTMAQLLRTVARPASFRSFTTLKLLSIPSAVVHPRPAKKISVVPYHRPSTSNRA
jgi:hypothetical protein